MLPREKKRVLELPEFKKAKRQKTESDKALKKRQIEFVKLLKSLTKEELDQACLIVENMYPRAVKSRSNGKKTH